MSDFPVFECDVCGGSVRAKPPSNSGIAIEVGQRSSGLLCNCNDVPMERVA